MDDLVGNRILQATFIAWALAQTLKVVIDLIRKRRFDLRLLTSEGGMPSSHTATVSALATAIGITEGMASSLFAVASVLAVVVMYDATGVRRSTGIQARILNQIIDELFQGHPISETHLRELLGHTPIQVFAGAALGILVSWLWLQS